MTAARDEVLARIAGALRPGAGRTGTEMAQAEIPRAEKARAETPRPEIPRQYRRAGDSALSPEELVELLVDRLVDYRAAVSRCAEAEVAAVLARRLTEHGIESVLAPDGFPERWLSDTAALRHADEALTPAQLDRIDGVLCTCALAIAETGTIVLDAGAGQGRRAVSLVPDYLLIVLSSDQVVAGVPDAVALLDPGRPLTWISGPSATSDIELNRVEGVHGPRTLDVILIEGASGG